MMKPKLFLMLLAATMAVILTAGSAHAKLVVEEQFIYNAGPIHDQNGGIGFDGPWISTKSHGQDYQAGLTTFNTGDGTTLNEDAGLYFSTLPVAGSALSRYGSAGRAEAHRLISAESRAALTQDNTTIWFSVLVSGTTPHLQASFIFGNEAFSTDIPFVLSAAGDGFGLTLANADRNNGDGTISAIAFDGSTTPNIVIGTFQQTLQVGGTHYDTSVIVGKINWKPNGTPDEFFLFNVTDLSSEPSEGEAFASITDQDLDQSDFNLVGMWDTSTTIFDEIRFGISYADAIGIPGPGNPSPANGEKVPIGNVDLSWTNMDPNNPGDSVYVDVWFGTEPNELHPNYDMTKVVTANPADPDRTTWTVNAPTEGTYYWQVNSYINGPDLINEPNMVEGPLWNFYATDDVPPSSVDAGVPMITWSGQPVPLDATVVDDGVSALTYDWTAEPAEGITVEFDPSAAVEDPAVTITKVPGFVPFVANGSFEADQQGEDGWGTTPGWVNAPGRSGNWNPPETGDLTAYTEGVPDGQMCAWAENDGGLSQVLTETLASDTTYELTVELGNSLRYDWGGYKVQLLAGGNLLAEDDDSLTIPVDSWATSTVVHTSGGAGDPNVGLPLEIRLLNKGEASVYAEINFDDIQLLIDGESGTYVYDPAMSTVELTLAVNDEGNPTPVTDSMAIDVYDNACLAAVGVGLATIDPSDFDANCITDIKDLATMLAKWLVDYALTAPIPK